MPWLKPKKQDESTLKKYRRLREETSELHRKVSDFLVSKKSVETAAKSLGLWYDKTIIMEDENDIAYIMDFSIFELRVGTTTAIQYFYDFGPELSAKEDRYLEELLENKISLFEVIAIDTPNYTAYLKDVLNDSQTIAITDVALSSQKQQIGFLIYTRILTIDGLSMTSGASMAFNPAHKAEILKRLNLQQFTKMRKLNQPELYVFFYKLFRSIGIETRQQ